MTTSRRRPIVRVLIGLVVAPVLVGSFWEAVTFFQEDDPWLAMIVLGTLAVLAVVVWLVSAERPEERWALVAQRAADWRPALGGQPVPDLVHAGLERRVGSFAWLHRDLPEEAPIDRRFVADSLGEVVEVGPLVSVDA